MAATEDADDDFESMSPARERLGAQIIRAIIIAVVLTFTAWLMTGYAFDWLAAK
jgi:hypothetical protein